VAAGVDPLAGREAAPEEGAAIEVVGGRRAAGATKVALFAGGRRRAGVVHHQRAGRGADRVDGAAFCGGGALLFGLALGGLRAGARADLLGLGDVDQLVGDHLGGRLRGGEGDVGAVGDGIDRHGDADPGAHAGEVDPEALGEGLAAGDGPARTGGAGGLQRGLGRGEALLGGLVAASAAAGGGGARGAGALLGGGRAAGQAGQGASNRRNGVG